jgi:hypothetical protein
MAMTSENSQSEVGLAARDMERELTRMIAHLDGAILALVFGLIAGVGLFAMTAILIVEAGPDTGAHLKLLSNFFPGYSVTWRGAFIGFLWAFASGAAVGWLIGYLYNRVASIRRKSSATGDA